MPQPYPFAARVRTRSARGAPKCYGRHSHEEADMGKTITDPRLAAQELKKLTDASAHTVFFGGNLFV